VAAAGVGGSCKAIWVVLRQQDAHWAPNQQGQQWQQVQEAPRVAAAGQGFRGSCSCNPTVP